MSETSKQSSNSKADEKVTSVEKSEKAKNPKRVELGKKLAKISKEAKERKARHHEAQCEAELERKVDRDDRSLAEEINDYVDFRYIVGGVTIVAALGGLYYAYKSDKRLERSESERSKRSESKLSEQNERSESESESKNKKVNIINKNDYEITKCNPPTSKSCIENL